MYQSSADLYRCPLVLTRPAIRAPSSFAVERSKPVIGLTKNKCGLSSSKPCNQSSTAIHGVSGQCESSQARHSSCRCPDGSGNFDIDPVTPTNRRRRSLENRARICGRGTVVRHADEMTTFTAGCARSTHSRLSRWQNSWSDRAPAGCITPSISRKSVCARQTHLDRTRRHWINLSRGQRFASGAAAARRRGWPCALATVSAHP